MGAYEDRVQQAELQHIADGIRKDYPNQIPNDADPRDIIAVHRQMHAPDMDPSQYVDVLRQAYGQDFKAPDRTLGENVSHGLDVAGSVLKSIPGAIKESFTAPVEAGAALGESVATSNARAAAADEAIKALHNPVPGPHMLSAHAPTAMEQQGQMMEKEQQLQATGRQKSAEGLATILTLPLGGEGAEVAKAAPLAGKVAIGALEGAGLTNAYAATQQGLQAQFEGKPAGEIYKAITSSVMNPTTAAFGAAFGGTASGIGGVLGEQAVAKKSTADVAQKLAMKNEMLSRFVDEVSPAQIKSRFMEDINEGAARGATPDVISRVILSKLTEDAPESIDPAVVEQFSGKVAKQMAADHDAAVGLAARNAAIPGEMPSANLPLPPSEPGAPPQIGQPAVPGAPPVEPAPVDLGQPTVTPTDEQGNLVLPGQPGQPTPQPPVPQVPNRTELTSAPMEPPQQFTPPAPDRVPGLTSAGEGVRVPGHEPPAVQGPLGERPAPFEPPTGVRRIKTERPFAEQKAGLLPREDYEDVLHGKDQGKTGNKVADNLNKMATEAKKRIAARKTGGLKGEVGAIGDLSGKGPQDWVGADFKDHALVLASDIFTRGLHTKQQITDWLTSKYGEAIKPHIDKLTEMAQKHIERMFGDTNNMEKKLSDLLELKESGRHGMNWYENTADWVHQHFGQDGDMMLRFLAVTSANGQTESGATLALKAFAQWKSGKPFTGFRGPSMVGQLERISRGESLGEHTKIENFYQALKGDPNAVVLDRWMMDAIGVKARGGSLREPDYKMYAHAVRDLAEQNGMTPRQFQAAVWEGARVRKAHITEAQGGRVLTTKSGSARPLEELVGRHLGFANVGEWVQDNQLNLSKMENLYNGLKPVREGKQSGFTFDPNTFAEDRTPGHVVTLATTTIDRKKFYPGELLKFRNQFKELIANPQGHHLTLGVYDMGNGKYSVDLNASMGENRKAAVDLGFKNRQKAIGYFDKSGNYEDIPTGYDEAKHGKQFVPPEKRSAQPAWYKQQQARLRTFLSGQGQLSLDSPAAKEDNKVQQTMVSKIGKVADPVTPKDTFDTGRHSGDPVWMTPDGKLFRGKSHEDIASKVAKAAGMTEKKTGYKGTSRWDNHALLQQGFARIQMFPDRMAVQLVGDLNGAARSTLNTLAKGRKFIGVVTSHAGDAEHGPYETPAKMFSATSRKD